MTRPLPPAGGCRHTFFALAGLSLLSHAPDRLDPIDPVYAMPPTVLLRYGVRSPLATDTDASATAAPDPHPRS